MRTQLKICTEEDYLQAHLTVIETESRDRGPAWRILEQRLASVLKKWMFGATTNLTSSFNPLLSLRAISAPAKLASPCQTSERGKES